MLCARAGKSFPSRARAAMSGVQYKDLAERISCVCSNGYSSPFLFLLSACGKRRSFIRILCKSKCRKKEVNGPYELLTKNLQKNCASSRCIDCTGCNKISAMNVVARSADCPCRKEVQIYLTCQGMYFLCTRELRHACDLIRYAGKTSI